MASKNKLKIKMQTKKFITPINGQRKWEYRSVCGRYSGHVIETGFYLAILEAENYLKKLGAELDRASMEEVQIRYVNNFI